MTNHEILQIKPGATKEEIKKAFYKLAHIHHPDKGGDEKVFKEINNAYQELMKAPTFNNFFYGSSYGGMNDWTVHYEYWEPKQERSDREDAAAYAAEAMRQNRQAEDLSEQIKNANRDLETLMKAFNEMLRRQGR